MADYTPITNFSAKDAMASGNPAKRALGTEITAELNAIATAIATKANSASPVFTGNVARFNGATNPGWSAVYSVAQLSAEGAVAAGTATGDWTFLAANTYYDGTNWRRIGTGESVLVSAAPGGKGLHVFRQPAGAAGGVVTPYLTLEASASTLRVNGSSDVTGYGAVSPGDTSLVVNAPSTGNVPAVWFAKNGLPRAVIHSQGAEGGGDTGSDLYLSTATDAGAYKEAVLVFNRATGLGTVKGDPTAALGIATKQYVDAAGATLVSSGVLTFAGATVTAGSTYSPATQSIGTVAVGDILTYTTRVVATAADGLFFYSRQFSSGFSDGTEGYTTHRITTNANHNDVYTAGSQSRSAAAGAATTQPTIINVGGTDLIVSSITVTYAVLRP